MIEFYIDNIDARDFHIRMGKTFLTAIDGFIETKEMIKSNSRIKDGQTTIIKDVRAEAREVALPIVFLEGKDAEGVQRTAYYYKTQFEQYILAHTKIDVRVPFFGRTYHLTYTGRNVSYAVSRTNKVIGVTLKFSEDNPLNRE